MKIDCSEAFCLSPEACDGLTGLRFPLEMDDGADHALAFLAPDTLRWDGEALPYRGAKGGEGLYFLSFDRRGEPRENLTLALDLSAGLVTVVEARQGLNPRRPSYIDVSIRTGAVRAEDGTLPPKRHGYTADLVGKAVKWQYDGGFSIIHIYLSERYYRIQLLQRMGDPDSPYEQAMRNYTDRTEPAFYLRLRPGVYLFGFVEDNMDKVTGPEISCASRVQLIDTACMKTVGRGFGPPGAPLELFVAQGEFVTLPAEAFSEKQAYTI